MIFVITGSEAFPFDRLIQAVDLLKKNEVIRTEVFIQLGSCNYIPLYCNYEKWLPFNRMRENIEASDIIITHAGAGTTLLCLEMGKMPLLVTRRKQYGEHIDDHQIQFARMMDKLGYAAVAYDVSELPEVFKRVEEKVFKKTIVNKEKNELISALNQWFETD